MKKYTHILFDLDGTLTDPKEGIINSVQYALKRFGIERKDEELLHFIGPPLHKSFEEILGTEEKGFEAVAVYREYYSVKGIFENKLYPDIRELLQKLKKSEKKLYIATSKPTVFAEQIAHHFQIHQYFERVAGSNLDGSKTDKSEVIQDILSELNNFSKNELIMIGDRKYDIIGAKYHGMDSIAVAYGYGSNNELTAANPTYHANSVDALEKLLLS